MDILKKYWKSILIVVLCFLVEVILSNFSAMSVLFSGAEEKTLDLREASVQDADEDVAVYYGEMHLKKGALFFENIDTPIKNVCLELSSEEKETEQLVSVGICFTDKNFAYDNGFTYNRAYVTMYAGDHNKNYFGFSSYESAETLCIMINETAKPITISSVTINSAQPFHISCVRLIFFLAVCFIIKTGFWKKSISSKRSFAVAVSAGMICIAVIAMLAGMNYVNDDVNLLDEYPAENISSEDQYTQLFDAFKKGQLNLEIDCDVEKLAGLNNPYDRSERIEEGLGGDLWDRAFYDGQFYCYFGAAPVFTVYFPIYFLTHKTPSALLASGVLCIYAVIFMSLLYNLIIKKFFKGAPVVLTVLGHWALVFGSLIFAFTVEVKFYYIAVLSGIGCVAAFFYFILKAYYENKLSRRIIFLVLTGLSVVMIVASRPSLVMYCFAALVPAIFIFADKKEKLTNKILYVVSIGVPVIAGAVLIMVYNYARFDNPFEFGFNYQLTVTMAQANTITLAMLPAAIYHYFFQPVGASLDFPQIKIQAASLSAYPRYSYIDRNIGVFNYPIAWAMFLAPFTFKKKDKFKNFFFGTIAVAAVIIAFTNMCTAGVHYRYMGDIMMPLLLVALVSAFSLLESLKNAPGKIYNTAYAFVAVAMIVTFVIGYYIMFGNELRNLIDEYPAVVHFMTLL